MRRSQRTTAKCPRCQAEVEDKTHIIRCPAPSARTQWALSLATLDNWLKDQGTDPLLRKRLILALNDWANVAEPQAPSPTAYETEQAHIGWDRMMDGWISRKWRDHQERIWKSIKSRKSSLRWTAALIQKMWDVSWDMWEHRNKELHEGDTAQQAILHSAVDAQIKKLYEGGAQQLPRDALKFLQTPQETVLSYTLALKRLWLESVKAAQQRWKKHEFGKYQSEQRLMAEWLSTAKPRNTNQTSQSG